MRSVLSFREAETAVALSADLHMHSCFPKLLASPCRYADSTQRWRLCLDAAVWLEIVAARAEAQWGETHDFPLAIASLTEQLISGGDEDLERAAAAALAASSIA
jgi:hypothetical protein